MQHIKRRLNKLTVLQQMNAAHKNKVRLQLSKHQQNKLALEHNIAQEKEVLASLMGQLDDTLQAGATIDIHRQQRMREYVANQAGQIHRLEASLGQIDAVIEQSRATLLTIQIDAMRLDKLTNKNQSHYSEQTQKRDDQLLDELQVCRFGRSS